MKFPHREAAEAHKRSQVRKVSRQAGSAGARYFPHLRGRRCGEVERKSGGQCRSGKEGRTFVCVGAEHGLHVQKDCCICDVADAVMFPQKRKGFRSGRKNHRTGCAEAVKIPQIRNL